MKPLCLLFMATVWLNIFSFQAPNGQRNITRTAYKAFKNCNSTVCAARVSFCIIMKDCGCGTEASSELCECCENCYRCLGSHLWAKCCSCVGLCGNWTLNFTALNATGIPSKPGNLTGKALPSLFELLSYQSKLPVTFLTRPRKGNFTGTSSRRHQCKVAFYNTCISKEDCISSCSSMGASKYRWFRNGCCQCIGSRCHDYGELNPLCKECQAD